MKFIEPVEEIRIPTIIWLGNKMVNLCGIARTKVYLSNIINHCTDYNINVRMTTCHSIEWFSHLLDEVINTLKNCIKRQKRKANSVIKGPTCPLVDFSLHLAQMCTNKSTNMFRHAVDIQTLNELHKRVLLYEKASLVVGNQTSEYVSCKVIEKIIKNLKSLKGYTESYCANRLRDEELGLNNSNMGVTHDSMLIYMEYI